jgi:cell division protease FtsH
MPSSYPLLESLFGDKTVVCIDMELCNRALEQNDALMPFYCLQIENATHGTDDQDKVVSCDYVKNEKSLLYLKTENVEILDLEKACSILSSLREPLIKRRCITEKPDGNIDISALTEHFRTQLKEFADDTKFSVQYLDKILEKYKPSSSSISPTIEKNTAGETNIENPILEKFDLKTSFIKQNTSIKQLFEEIAIVRVAGYLNQNPEKSVFDVKASNLPEVSIETLFAASLATPAFLNHLANKWMVLPYQVLMLPFVSEVRALIERVVDKRTSQVNDAGSKSWYGYAKQLASQLSFDENVEKLLSESHDDGVIDVMDLVNHLLKIDHPAVEAFLVLNECLPNTIERVKASKSLGKKLKRQVIGQDQAINSVVKGILSSSLKAVQGPRLIFTFVGPSGIGKTYLASMLATALNEVEGSDYRFTNYNMESYSEERDASMLFGSGSQYSDSALGLLTTSVRNYPRQVILFDEIEKAHSSVVTSLLSLLDDGIANDKTTQESIDFSQCIVIFTSNLGQDTFLKNASEQSLNVFDVLKTAKNPDTGVGFSPELVNRLAKGYPIIFTPLKVNHLIRLAEDALASSSYTMNDVRFNFPLEFSSFLLQSIAPEISVRRLQTSVAKFQADTLLGAVDCASTDNDKTVIDVTLDSRFQSIEEPIKLLLLDNDAALTDQLGKSLRDTNISAIDDVAIHHCTALNLLKVQLESQKPDAVLIDVDVAHTEETLQSAINTIIAFNKRIAIFTFKLMGSTDERQVTNLHHEVREHFALAHSEDASQQFNYLISRVRFYLVTEKQINQMTQRHQSLAFSQNYSQTPTGAALTLSDFTYEQLVFSEDISNTTLFKYSLPTLKLNDVIGLTRAKKRLVEVVEWMKNPAKLLMANVKLPTGFLFAGPSGTGKTMLARALASECQMPFFSVSAADLSSSHVGGTTENIKQLFDTARKYAPAIIFIDEIDAIAGDRERRTTSDGHMVVNTLLTEMDGFNESQEPLFVLAATNYPQALDSALLRPGRFDETITCDLPNKDARTQFFERFMVKHHLHWERTETELLVRRTQGFSSSLIEQVLRESIYESVSNEKSITSEVIQHCITRISYGLPSDTVVMSEEEKVRTAYHETGHLIAYKLLFPELRVEFVTIIPREQALGFVATARPDEYNSNTRDTISRYLQVMLAGRVAEKIYHGSSDLVSTGASSDIEKATHMAMNAIYEGGLSADIGPVNLNMLTKFEESNLLHVAQENVRQWIEQSERNVEKLIIDNNELFHFFAQKLIQKESMHADEIDDTIKSFEA